MSPAVSAILLDAAGVLFFPQPGFMLEQLKTVGLAPEPEVLDRAHFRAMAVQDVAGRASRTGGWWPGYLEAYFAACGVPDAELPALAERAAAATTRGVWTHIRPETNSGLRALASLGLPLGVVSNADGRLQAALASLGLLHVPGSDGPAAGVPVGVVLDSTRAGVAKPDPAIFLLALDSLGVPPSPAVLHVGDSLRSDVDGALAAGLQPVHFDPYGTCPTPGGHPHARSLTDLAHSLNGTG